MEQRSLLCPIFLAEMTMACGSEHAISSETAERLIQQHGGEDLNTCLTCSDCASTCFLSEFYPDMTPMEISRKVLGGCTQELVDSEFLWACTLCTRCTVDCPKGLHLDALTRAVRGIGLQQGKAPKRLQEGLAMIKEAGNSVGVSTEEFVDSIQWLGEEAAEELLGDEAEDFTVPIDKEGAHYLYVPNPREFTSAPNMFSVYLKFFLASGIDWTFASNVCDISNWAYYMGDEETNLKLVRNIVDTAKRLGVKGILSTECGHGYKVLRKDAEQMIGEPLGLEITSVVELAHRFFKDGTLRLRQGAIDERVTYHDPCNVGRKLDVYEPPRELLRHIAREYVDMTPHGKHAICCAGGGSVAQNTDMGKRRLECAKAKRDQIVATGATMVTTSCQMCLAQLADIQAHYNLPVQTKTVMELVVEAIEV
jgi:Fe-S oxidoreductase